jgi:Bacterial Ig-like domain (group 2)
MRWRTLVTVLILVSSLAGCGGSAPTVVPVPVLSSVTVSPSSGSYVAPATQQFTATGHYSDGSTKDITLSVTWSSSNTTVASVSNNAGSQGLASMVGTGSANITAGLGTARGSASVTVTSSLTSIDVAPASANLQPSATQQFTATGHYDDNSSKDVTQSATWSSSNTQVATVSNSAGSQGLATMVGSGSASITAAMGSVQGSSSVTVTSSVSVSVSPSFASVTVTHQNQPFTATVLGTTNTAVTWFVDGVDGGNSTVGTISSSGLYTPPGTKGFHTITATSQADLGKSASAQVAVSDNPGVFTRGYDNARTGLNPNEIVLTPQNVNSKQFGKLFSYSVDGGMYAEPLYVANVELPDHTFHNIVYVATTSDMVYAFDADNPSVGLIWKTSLVDGANGETTVPCTEEFEACGFYWFSIGITGTPVIDSQTGTLYVAAFSEINGVYYQKLHALDIATGTEKFGGPVAIEGSVPGTGDGGDGTTLPFDPYYHLQRPSLLLANGLVYIGFASYGDLRPFHGWLFAYDAKTLKRVAIFNATPDGEDGGIWQSANGPAADASGNIYVVTGNGDFNADNAGGRDYGDSFIKLSPQLTVEDYFTPFDQANLDINDVDLGSGGPVLLPDQVGPYPHLLIGGGKEGILYLLNRDNLGKYNATDNGQIVQSLPGQTGTLFGNGAYWNSNLYFQGINSVMEMFTIKNNMLSTTPVSQGQFLAPFPGLTPEVSANGEKNGIVWTLETGTHGVLRAYDATDVSVELYDSNQAANGRDWAASQIKFQMPTVINGKVYIGTSGQLDVYGLLPQ